MYSLTLHPPEKFVPTKRPAIKVQERVPQDKKQGLGRKFSIDETEYLQAGITKFGAGQWKVILRFYPFHPCRTSISLKDKARNMNGRYPHS